MIVKSRGGDIAIRSTPAFNEWPGRANSASGIAVTPRSMSSIPAAYQAIRIASQAVAQLRFRVWRGDGFERRRITTTWQARFFDSQPNDREPWFNLWEQTEDSLTSRNNAYWLKARDQQGRVSLVYLLHPDTVAVGWDADRQRKTFTINVPGLGAYKLDSSSVLHFRGGGDPGALVAPSPVELFADSIGATLAKIRHEARHYERGLQQKTAVIFPRGIGEDEAKRWREAFDSQNAGWQNGSRTAVLGDGADIKTIGLTMADSQFIESMRFGIEDTGRIFNVTASLLGPGGSGMADRPISPEHEQARWLRYGLTPRLLRIESAIQHDPDFFGVGARDYPMFDTDGFLRGDLATEADIILKEVQSGQLLVDEARALRGRGPLPPVPADPMQEPGKIPQVVPVGGSPYGVPIAPSGGAES